MRIAILSFDFLESSLPLAKHLSKLKDVTYFVFTSVQRKNQPGLDLSNQFFWFGVNEIILDKHKLLKSYLEDSQLKIFAIHYFPGRKSFSLLNRTIKNKAVAFINKQNYDIVNIIGQSHELLNYHLKIKSKLIHSFHEIYNHQDDKPLNNELIRYITSTNTYIILHSIFNHKRFKELYPQNKNVYVIPFGLFESYCVYKNVRLSRKNSTVLFIGHINKYKGIHVLLDAFKIVNAKIPDSELMIAGKINRAFKKEFLKLQRPKNCLFINRYLSNKEIVGLIQQATLVVCPYTSASQSGIPMLVFVLNKCIIATNVGAFKEVIKNEINGILIEPNNHAILANKIIELLECKERIAEIEANTYNFEQINPYYTWKLIANKTIEAYTEAIN